MTGILESAKAKWRAGIANYNEKRIERERIKALRILKLKTQLEALLKLTEPDGSKVNEHPRLELLAQGVVFLIFSAGFIYAATRFEWWWLLFPSAAAGAFGVASLIVAPFKGISEPWGGAPTLYLTLGILGVPVAYVALSGIGKELEGTPPWAWVIILLLVAILYQLNRHSE